MRSQWMVLIHRKTLNRFYKRHVLHVTPRIPLHLVFWNHLIEKESFDGLDLSSVPLYLTLSRIVKKRPKHLLGALKNNSKIEIMWHNGLNQWLTWRSTVAPSGGVFTERNVKQTLEIKVFKSNVMCACVKVSVDRLNWYQISFVQNFLLYLPD